MFPESDITAVESYELAAENWHDGLLAKVIHTLNVKVMDMQLKNNSR
jgi:hypothetical protein